MTNRNVKQWYNLLVIDSEYDMLGS
jgi:hypothetical protein